MINNIFIIKDTFIKLINKIIVNNIIVNKAFMINILFTKHNDDKFYIFLKRSIYYNFS